MGVRLTPLSLCVSSTVFIANEFNDVDFFLSGTAGAMTVTETSVHKLNGRPFYLWEQNEDEHWDRDDDEDGDEDEHLDRDDDEDRDNDEDENDEDEGESLRDELNDLREQVTHMRELMEEILDRLK